MIYSKPVIYYIIILSLSLWLFPSLLFSIQASTSPYVTRTTTFEQATTQQSTYVPPEDIGLPQRREPGSTR